MTLGIRPKYNTNRKFKKLIKRIFTLVLRKKIRYNINTNKILKIVSKLFRYLKTVSKVEVTDGNIVMSLELF